MPQRCSLFAPRRPKNPASGKLLIRAFVASIYFWAAVVKLRADWLDGRTLALFHENGALVGPVADLMLSTEGLRSLIACSIVAIELSLPALLFMPRTRRWAPLVALSLHACIEIAAAPDLIGWAMAALLLSTLPHHPQHQRGVGHTGAPSSRHLRHSPTASPVG